MTRTSRAISIAVVCVSPWLFASNAPFALPTPPSKLAQMTAAIEKTTFEKVIETKHPDIDAPKHAYTLNPKALKLGLHAYQCALKKRLVKKPLLTIVDFTEPSSQKRLWVINPVSHKVIHKLLVAQGENSGDMYAKWFSNKPNSHQSSLGVFITGKTYYGRHGYSLLLDGLEKGINNNAMRRHIVVHASWYVTPTYVQNHGKLAHSWGCFSINPDMVRHIINEIKRGSVLFAYAPQEDDDTFLAQC